MADSEERPSKIRKLDPEFISEPGGKDEKNTNSVVDVTSKSHETITFGTSASARVENVVRTPDDHNDTLASVDGASSVKENNGVSKVQGSNDGAPVMSKSQRKKLLKKQQREEGRSAWKAERKLKDKEKKARKRAEKEAAPPVPPVSPTARRQAHHRPTQVPLTFILDCNFDDLMIDKEITSLSAQIARAYSENRSGKYRANLVVSSFGGQLKERFDTVLAKTYQGWRGVTFTEKGFLDAAEEAHAVMYGPRAGRVDGALLPHGLAGTHTSGQEKPVGDVMMDKMPNNLEIESKDESIAEDAQREDSKPATQRAEPIVDNFSTITESKPSTERPSTNIAEVPPLVEELRPLFKHIRGPDVLTTPSPTQPSTIYLSSDSPNTLTHLSPHTTYIIGGIVDKNRHKGICYKAAREAGIPTAKLPIGEYMEMQSRAVLATNHVVEIMVRWLECGDWGEAFVKVIPKRKEARLKGKAKNEREKAEGSRMGAEEGGRGDDPAGTDADTQIDVKTDGGGDAITEATN